MFGTIRDVRRELIRNDVPVERKVLEYYEEILKVLSFETFYWHRRTEPYSLGKNIKANEVTYILSQISLILSYAIIIYIMLNKSSSNII